MDILFGASIIASFIAGMVALFAPCCITVLLPAYIASAFRQKRNILKMTFIFFAGISTVLIPIGLGAAALAQLFRDFHKELWIFGGIFMLLLALYSVLGKGMSLPFAKNLKPKMGRGEMKKRSVYILGVLSGAATSCCAPVLAGAMTLAVLSGTFWKALIVTFAYVFGMVFPLFLTAFFYDKYKIEQSKIIKGKLIDISLGAKKITVHSTNLVAAFVFLIIGTTMLYLGLSGNAFYSPEHQAELGVTLNDWSNDFLSMFSLIPEAVWGALVLGIFFFFILVLRKRKGETLSNEDETGECCEKETDKNT